MDETKNTLHTERMLYIGTVISKNGLSDCPFFVHFSATPEYRDAGLLAWNLQCHGVRSKLGQDAINHEGEMLKTMDFACLVTDVRDGIGIVTINRPEILNVLSPVVYHELNSSLMELTTDSTVKVVIITGAGSKAFAAGADILSMSSMNSDEALQFATIAQETLLIIETMPKLVIAAINGLALGGGFELALACDFRLAVRSAKLGLPEITLGIIPGSGGTQRLTGLVGVSKAKEMILLAEILTAEEALAIGLINKVVEGEQLMVAAMELAQRLSPQAPVAMAMAKRSIRRATGLDSRGGLEFEANCFAHCFSTQDQKERMQAFIEKRKPQITDR